MKYCPNCNQPCEDTETFCGNCGANLNAAPDPSAAYGAAPRVSTKKEFLNLPENKKVKKVILPDSVEIINSLAFAECDNLKKIFVHKNSKLKFESFIFRWIYFCSFKTRSSASSMIIGIIQTGRPSGYLVLIAGIFAVIYTFKAEKLWKQYQQV